MRQITTRLSTPEPLEPRLALDATFSQLYLQPTGNQFEAGHTIAELVKGLLSKKQRHAQSTYLYF